MITPLCVRRSNLPAQGLDERDEPVQGGPVDNRGLSGRGCACQAPARQAHPEKPLDLAKGLGALCFLLLAFYDMAPPSGV